jgi:hypothetical protein
MIDLDKLERFYASIPGPLHVGPDHNGGERNIFAREDNEEIYIAGHILSATAVDLVDAVNALPTLIAELRAAREAIQVIRTGNYNPTRRKEVLAAYDASINEAGTDL